MLACSCRMPAAPLLLGPSWSLLRRSVLQLSAHMLPLHSPAQVWDPELRQLLGEARYFSITYRLFKLAGVETTCEDYGQACRYKVGR